MKASTQYSLGEQDHQMSPTNEHSFRTRTGTCTITADRIILTGEQTKGAMAGILIGNSTVHPLILYAVFGAICFALSTMAIRNERIFPEIILCAAVAFYLTGFIQTKQLSTVPEIERASIRNIDAHPPYPPSMRGYFTVLFEEGGKLRKRMIMLPESTDGGEEEYERAESILVRNGLLEATR